MSNTLCIVSITVLPEMDGHRLIGGWAGWMMDLSGIRRLDFRQEDDSLKVRILERPPMEARR